MKQRILGFDIARALAIFGMVIVNFKIAMNAEMGNGFLLKFASLFEGRASALFVVLAGVGVTFLTNTARKSQETTLILGARKSLIKRGLLLIFLGLIYTPIWPADILHFYGFYFLMATALFNIKDKALLLVGVLITLLFPLLMLFFDYQQGWDWTTLTYHGFWSVDGMIRHILFNGFHPVFPWCAFLVFGMWLGRQNLSVTAVRKKIFLWSISIWAVTELAFFTIRTLISDESSADLNLEVINFLFSTAIIPPMPQYVVAAGSLAVAIIIGCLSIAEKFAHHKWSLWLCQTGQLSLTLYVAHVFFGMGFLEAIGRLDNQTIEFSLFSAAVFSAFAVLFSVTWLKYFKTGPLEWFFRKVAR